MTQAHEIIREMYRQYWRYMIAKEVFLEGLLDGTFNYYSADHDGIEVEIDGDRATMVGRSRVAAAVYGGRRSTWRLQGDFTLRRTRDGWRFTSSRASTY